MHCLWCDEVIIPEINWNNIIYMSKPKNLCVACESNLEILAGKRCGRCSRPSDKMICADCLWWNQYTEGRDPLESNYSVFTYNDRMQEMVAKWKYRGDYCLGNAFKQIFYESFNRHFTFLPKNVVVVPIPLSAERIRERKFNQAKLLAAFLPIKMLEILSRTDSEKQSKKTRKERLSTKNPFEVSVKVNKSVILVDDIYTTGSTLRHAATVLKKNGSPSVYAYTLIRG